MDLTLESVLEINKQRIEAIPTGNVDKYYLNSNFRKIAPYDCPANSSFTKMLPACVPSCNDPDLIVCYRDNFSHCICIEGYVKNATDDCIRIEDCPNIKLKSAEAFEYYILLVMQHVKIPSFDVSKNTNGCHCLPGFVRNEHYQCVKLEECPDVTNEPTSNAEDSYNIDPNNPQTTKLLREVSGTLHDWYAETNQDQVDDEYPTLKKDTQKVLSEPWGSGYVNHHTDLDLDDPETQRILQQIFGPNNFNTH
ncbi:hypothetical protein KQX54_005838 [Cotesia glomerata]|uniref:TIL domain-containing protein n=1 Tax=Cotesia glomerata TaxID=32391 RepID=A0AAV7IW95_COTGL|nr:hypothetical protein KQX54_005838 [Cotesia glomerata]